MYHVLERYSYIAASSWGISDAPATGQFAKYQTWLMVMTIEKDFTHKERRISLTRRTEQGRTALLTSELAIRQAQLAPCNPVAGLRIALPILGGRLLLPYRTCLVVSGRHTLSGPPYTSRVRFKTNWSRRISLRLKIFSIQAQQGNIQSVTVRDLQV